MNEVELHRVLVDSWLARVAAIATASRLAELLVSGVHAIWARAQHTLGTVTMVAVVDRVLMQAKRRFPLLTPVLVGSGGLSADMLHRTIVEEDAAQLRAAAAFVLVELLTVLDAMTAGVLTADLHDALVWVGTDGWNATGDAAHPSDSAQRVSETRVAEMHVPEVVAGDRDASQDDGEGAA